MKLYGKNMTRSFRCLWAAEEAGIECEYIPVEFGDSGEFGTNSDKYRDLNSQGKVPTLVDEEVEGGPLVLTESAAIVNYLAAKSDNALRPAFTDIVTNARYEELMFFIMADLEQPLWTCGKHKFAIPKEHRVAEVLNTTVWEFAKSQKALTKLIGESPRYAMGDSFTMADVMLGHTLTWAEAFKFELLPGFKAYKDELYKREACLRALAKANGK